MTKPPDIPADASDLLGTVISGQSSTYKILEFIGRGGTSDVYKARVESTLNENPINPIRSRRVGQIFACKILFARLLDHKEHYKRFQNEVRVAKRLAHKNIVSVYDAGDVDGRPFMIMDYLDSSLADIYTAEGKLPIHRALPIFLQISDAFTYAHQREVVHRDLKPSNVMVSQENGVSDLVKIVDFGISKIINETTMGATQLTKTGDIFGTPTHMSPEQCLGNKVDHRSDIYSMGILMYEVLTGRLPLKGDTQLVTISKQVSEMPKGLGEIDPDPVLAKKMESIIFKCLEKEPSSRYQKMDVLRLDLELVRLRLEQVRSGKTNKIYLALERACLFLFQFIRWIYKPIFSKQISSSGTTLGSVIVIAGSSVLLAVMVSWFLLFSLPSGASIADRELPLKPIIDQSVKAPDQNAGEALWHKLQSSSARQPDILERALKIFVHLGNLNQQSANYSRADLCYSRAEQIARLLKLESSIVIADILNFHAENQLFANLAEGSIGQQKNELLVLKDKKFDLFVKPEILRKMGLIRSSNAAEARDYSLGALTIMDKLGKRTGSQSLLAYGLLAESALELGIVKGSIDTFDTFKQLSLNANEFNELDKHRSAIVLAWAGRAYLGQHRLEDSKDMLLRSQVCYSEIGQPEQYNMAVICNDLGLIQELSGENVQAETLFRQAYSSLIAAGIDDRQYRFLVLSNIASSAYRAHDYLTAMKSKLTALTNAPVQL
jgi:serine/threonine protein kinase